MSRAPIFIEAYGLACALGADSASVADQLFSGAPLRPLAKASLIDGREVAVGHVPLALEPAPGETRTNALLTHCYGQIAEAVAGARARFGAHRLAVVMGSCTSGIREAGAALEFKRDHGDWPMGFSMEMQQLDDGAWCAARLAQARGPVYSISTACTSSARALAAGGRLLQAGLCDAVICGGVDTLSPLTLNGFGTLESLSRGRCNPMSANRDGIHIGEAGALFLLTREPSAFRLAGWGESADAYHMSAPDPSGAGAELALRAALANAGFVAGDIGFVHLHGTATRLNDAMEASVVHRVFGDAIPACSTKPLTGHTLGAAGALQAAFCLLALERGRLPPHHWDGVRDTALAPIRLAQENEPCSGKPMVSASYAFGGNNAALVLARA